jgi:hypothetical protein
VNPLAGRPPERSVPCEVPGVNTKSTLKQELVALLAADLETAERAQQAAREGATHEEAKPENDKDTRALEQSYVARGQAKRVEELGGSPPGSPSEGTFPGSPSEGTFPSNFLCPDPKITA